MDSVLGGDNVPLRNQMRTACGLSIRIGCGSRLSCQLKQVAKLRPESANGAKVAARLKGAQFSQEQRIGPGESTAQSILRPKAEQAQIDPGRRRRTGNGQPLNGEITCRTCIPTE